MVLKEINLAFRKLIQEVHYTWINLLGLTLSISFSFLIYLYVEGELSYDKHQPENENIYRIAANFELNGHEDVYSNTPRPMGRALVEEFPGILKATKILGFKGLQNHSGYLGNDEEHIYTSHLFIADSSFFDVFKTEFILGSPQTFRQPNQIVLSKSLADALFPEGDPIGKIITLEDEKKVAVSAVFADHPPSTYLRFDAIVSYSTYYRTMDSEKWWYGGHVFTYVRTIPGFEPQEVLDNWPSFFNKYMKRTFDELNGRANIIFQPLYQVYMSPELIWEPYPHGNWEHIYIFGTVGLFLVLIACFNYSSLSMSQSLSRTREIGIRKVLGASDAHIVRQYVLEAAMLSLFAGLTSISVLSVSTSLLFDVLKQPMQIDFVGQPTQILVIFSLSLFYGSFSNLVPALLASSLGLAATQQKLAKSAGRNFFIRKLFVTVQQMISVTLVIYTLTVIDQINHVKNLDIGFEKKDLILVSLRDEHVREHAHLFNLSST